MSEAFASAIDTAAKMEVGERLLHSVASDVVQEGLTVDLGDFPLIQLGKMFDCLLAF